MRKMLPLFGLLWMVWVLACADAGKKDAGSASSNATPPPATAAQPAASSTPAKEAVNPVTWKEFDSLFSVKSKKTDIQKEEAWKRFEGQRVAWVGEVSEVAKGTFGGLTLNVKMNPDTLTFDVAVALKPEQESKAAQLSKGSKVSFVGTLKSYGGAVLPTSLEDGEIR